MATTSHSTDISSVEWLKMLLASDLLSFTGVCACGRKIFSSHSKRCVRCNARARAAMPSQRRKGGH